VLRGRNQVAEKAEGGDADGQFVLPQGFHDEGNEDP
jgi:hypothetical protein